MHVLAVSGLHISIIYMLLIAVLRPLKKSTTGKIILAVAGLGVLWGYAFVTGLSPSVLRAVTMFSFMAVAKPMERNTNIFNTMAASAFLLLVFDPLLIMSVGFQLSYLAVIGIVAIHPELYATWQPRLRVVDEVWKISSVSIAAQVSTFGLGLLYFNQFPNYFLLSNLLVIPISFVVLIAGIAVIAFSWIPFVGSALGWVLTWSIKLLNHSVFFVERIPFNLVENIHITPLQCLLLMVMAFAIVLLFQKKRLYWMIVSFLAALGFSALQWTHFFEQVNAREIAVYNVRDHTAIDLFDNGECVFITDSAYVKNRSDIKFHIVPNRVLHGITRVLPDSCVRHVNVPGGRIISWNGQLIANISSRDFLPPSHARFDYAIISNNSAVDLQQIFLLSRQVILDGSNSYYYSKRMVDIALKKNLKIHAVGIHGAFTARLDQAHKSFL